LGQIVRKQIVVSPEPISQTKPRLFRKKRRKTQYWLELLLDSGLANDQGAQELLQESSELLAIFASIGKKLKE